MGDLKKNIYPNSGVSLIELILVVAITLIIGGAGVVFGSNFLQSSSLEGKYEEVVSVIRNAQLNALSSRQDSKWGVKTTPSAIILFKGATYDTRDQTYDESYSIPSTVAISESEVVFEKVSGNPNSITTISISSQNGESYTLDINELGIVNIN